MATQPKQGFQLTVPCINETKEATLAAAETNGDNNDTNSESIEEKYCVQDKYTQDPTNALTETGQFKCHSCTKVFSDELEYEHHQSLHSFGAVEHQCDLCLKIFSANKDLRLHQAKHVDEKLLKCSQCHKHFFQASNLFAHEQSHTRIQTHKAEKDKAQERPFRCDLCGKTFIQKCVLMNHVARHTGDKPLKCELCEERFFVKKDLNEHMLRHQVAEPFECENCGRKYQTQMGLNSHKRNSCRSTSQISQSRSIPNSQELHPCTKCNVYFGCEAHLMSHHKSCHEEKPESEQAASHPELKCRNCAKMFKNAGAYRNHVKTKCHTRYQCGTCGKTYISVDFLKEHIAVHTGIKPHVCEVCNQKFVQPHKLQVHLQTHRDGGPYNCRHCRRKFVLLEDFQSHIKRHKVDKYQCDLCSRTFETKEALKTHIDYHNKRWSCTECGQNFHYKKSLNVHLENKHKKQTGKEGTANDGLDTSNKKSIQSVDSDEPLPTKKDVRQTEGTETGSFSKSKKNEAGSTLVGHKCDICQKVLSNKQHFRHHLETHDPKFKCYRCDKKFTTQKLLEKHERIYSSEPLPRPFQCGHCGNTFTGKDQLKSHLITHTSSCSYEHKNKTNRGVQQSAEHGIDKGSSASEHVDSTMKNHDKLRKDHVSDHDQSVEKSGIISVKDENIQPRLKCPECGEMFIEEMGMSFHKCPGNKKCELCNEIFTNQNDLQYHKCSMHKNLDPYFCDICKKGYLCPATSMSLPCKHEGKCLRKQEFKLNGYKCHICSKVFNYNSQLKAHQKTHNPQFKCPECDKRFASCQALKKHQLKKHSTKPTPKLFQCEQCGKAFKEKGNLKVHLQSHSGLTPYKCKVCNKSFRYKSTLAIHNREHTGERPFVCEICAKTFISSGRLSSHRKCHGEKETFPCEHCNKPYGSKQALKQHYETHTRGRIPCPHCDKTFVSEKCVTTHIRNVHQRERPYKCTKCDKGFWDKNYLLEHMSVHTKARPFRCDICNKTFGFRSVMQTHRKIHFKQKGVQPSTGKDINPIQTQGVSWGIWGDPSADKNVHPVTDIVVHPIANKDVHPSADKYVHSSADKGVHSSADKYMHPSADKYVHLSADKNVHPCANKDVHLPANLCMDAYGSKGWDPNKDTVPDQSYSAYIDTLLHQSANKEVNPCADVGTAITEQKDVDSSADGDFYPNVDQDFGLHTDNNVDSKLSDYNGVTGVDQGTKNNELGMEKDKCTDNDVDSGTDNSEVQSERVAVDQYANSRDQDMDMSDDKEVDPSSDQHRDQSGILHVDIKTEPIDEPAVSVDPTEDNQDKTVNDIDQSNVQVKDENDQPPFKCKKCDRVFAKEWGLSMHKCPMKYKCELCNQIFNNKRGFRDHNNSKHKDMQPYICDTCNMCYLLSADATGPPCKHTQKPKETQEPKLIEYKCEICAKIYTNKYSFRAHQKVHNPQFKCTDCDKWFAYSHTLKKHQLQMHPAGSAEPAPKPFQCEHCGKTFSEKGNMKAHLQSHSDLTPHVCQICNKSFRYRATLVVHSRKHTGEKPYVCEICAKSFISSGRLRSHKKLHGEKQTFLCEYCSKPYSSKQGLQKHYEMHSKGRLSCPHCDKTFAHRQVLSTHIRRVHDQEKNYKCPICNKGFWDNKYLTEHMTVHTKVRPFECDICNKAFGFRSAMLIHRKIHDKKAS